MTRLTLIKCLSTAAGVGLVLLGAWLAGFEFNERGANALFVYLFSLLVAFCTWTAPFYEWSDYSRRFGGHQ